jgi:hypothetical protein
MKHTVILICLTLHLGLIHAQVADNFADGNFTANPAWTGDDSLFQVNGAFQLQSKGTSAKDIALATSSNFAEDCEWSFWIRNAFSPSLQNFARYYLTSDSANLNMPLNGYYLQIGGITGNQDSLMLFRQNGLTRTWLAGGRPATVSKTNNTLRIRVLHDTSGNWTIYSDTTGGYNFVQEMSTNDRQIRTSKFTGVAFKYTAGNAANLYLDDVYAGPVIVDVDPPQVTEIEVIDSMTIKLHFSEPLDIVSATNPNHYEINSAIGNPISVSMINSKHVQLNLAHKLVNRSNYFLSVRDVKDQNQNKMILEQYPFLYVVAQYGDIIISEFFPDPSPQVGLPEQEFIELYNNSPFALSLKDWTYSDASATSKIPNAILQPDSFVILCHQNNVNLYQSFGRVIGLSSFPSLNNSGDNISIKDANGKTIHQLAYDLSWYQDNSKSDGGWSIEVINPHDLCKEKMNYTVSTHPSGGTPGWVNSNWTKYRDTIPPELLSVWAESATQIRLQFDEVMDTNSLKMANVNFNPPLNILSQSLPKQTNDQLMVTTLTAIAPNTKYQLDISQVRDCNQNGIVPVSKNFEWLVSDTAKQFDVLITEVMPKPDPVIGLPNAEYIELHNKSNRILSLQDWTISDPVSTARLPSLYLLPDSFVVITSLSNAPLFSTLTNVYGVGSFPSLGNAGDMLVLKNNVGQVIHAIQYASDWFGNNAQKANGGWSLEMVDVNNPCEGMRNWKPSTNSKGGTPGKMNSVIAVNKDLRKPVLLQAYPTSHNQIRISFDEYMDSTSISNTNVYSIQGLGSVSSVLLQPPFYQTAWVTFTDAIQPETIYKLKVDGANDCSGNMNDESITASFGKPEMPDSYDLVINEILFNPYADGVDFVELYNRSNKIIDLKNFSLASTDSDNSIKDFYPIADSGFLIFPNQYAVVTSMPSAVSKFYQVLYPELLIKAQLPTFANTSGTCVIVNQFGKRIDQLDYHEDMHFALLDDAKGVSLERINPQMPTQEKSNWASASYTSGYATPTYKNSQYLASSGTTDFLQILPETFSPDQDGYNDIISFNYRLPSQGYLANMFIYNSNGQLLKQLLRNHIMGTEGTVNWDGVTTDNAIAPIGIYIVWMEVFNLNGDVQRVKKAFVLAGKL